MVFINQIIPIFSLIIALIAFLSSFYVYSESKNNCEHVIMDEKLFKKTHMLDIETSVIAQTNIVNQEGSPVVFYYANADSYKMNPSTGFVDIFEKEKVVASLLIKNVQLITVNNTPGGLNNGKNR